MGEIVLTTGIFALFLQLVFLKINGLIYLCLCMFIRDNKNIVMQSNKNDSKE